MGISTDIRCREVIFSGVDAIILDKDGTLANSEQYLRELGARRSRQLDRHCPGIFSTLCQKFGIEANGVRADSLLASGTRQDNIEASISCLIDAGIHPSGADELVSHVFQDVDHSLDTKALLTPCFPEGVTLLKQLKSAGLQIGILSSDSTVNVQAFVQAYDLQDYIDASLGTDGGYTKPDPALFLWACDILAVAPGRTLMVGDSTTDMAMARNARALGSVGVLWGWTYAKCPEQADVIVNQFDQIEVICRMI